VDDFRTLEWPKASDLRELVVGEQSMTLGTVWSAGPVEDCFQPGTTYSIPSGLIVT